MSKERFLTVMVPIKDSDCEQTVYADLSALNAAVPPTIDNIDKIYKLADGSYMRLWLNPSTGQYEYHAVIDREFPYLGKPLEVFSFTYDSTRMGKAPTIFAQNVMWFAEKDANGNDVTLEGMWAQDCHVSFNGENFYLKQIPTSSKSNEDARYRYDLGFVSERVALERVYFYDIVSPFITEKPISESSSFSFYGDINELAKRINASLIRSGLSTLTRKYVAYPNRTEIVPYLSYEQWGMVNVNATRLVSDGVFVNVNEMNYFRTTIYTALSGDYNLYLMQYIYANDGGVYDIGGYRCIIGKDKFGDAQSSEEKLLSFDNNTIYEALQQFHDTFGIDYYVTREKDVSGDFTGNTLIVVGDCEHDFADWDETEQDYVRDSDGIPTTEKPFDYGVDNELLSKEKTNTTDKIVTRITGVGSEENIPWYYPNPNPDGWIKPIFKTKEEIQSSVTIDYPTDEGSTVADHVRYEKYLKNRIGKIIRYGAEMDFKSETEYSKIENVTVVGAYTYSFRVEYMVYNRTFPKPRLTFSMYYPSDSLCQRFDATLLRTSTGVEDDSYVSTQTYQNPTQFQTMCLNRDGNDATNISQNVAYTLKLSFYFNAKPLSRRYDYEGYHYNSTSVEYDGDTTPKYIVRPSDGQTYYHTYNVSVATAKENFYQYDNLQAFATWNDSEVYDESNLTCVHTITPTYVGYSTDGGLDGSVAPMPRYDGSQYKDVSNGTIYICTDDGDATDAFSANPTMSWEEWVVTFLDMKLRLFDASNWYIGSKRVELSDYGLGNPMQNGSAYTPDIFDVIDFQRLKWLTPQPNLMPEVYVNTDGERRFYNAHDYWDKDNGSLYVGTADTSIGEVQSGSYVKNPIYKENTTDADNKHYDFENEYIQRLPHEHIENFDDVKPTIKEQTNTVNGSEIRIDVVETFGYDWTDNDEIWESADGDGKNGEYKHPYFFAKLRPLGFNIFDLALQEDMVVSMTTGNCGACNFKIGVDENTKKNPVQLWEYDVYDGEDLRNATKLYDAGDLRRYVNTVGLYYDNNGTSVPVNSCIGNKGGGEEEDTNYGKMFSSYTYSVKDVENGYVGTTKKGGGMHFEGDVVTNGRYIESQQNTSENYVWVALMKDTDTYGTLMPSACPNFNNTNYDMYIEPKGINYKNRATGQTSVLTEDQADKFVLLNIVMPQIYLRRAERELSRKLVAYMYDNNYQKFNFSIKFSRIFLAQNEDVERDIDENSVVYVRFNNRTFRQYVKKYTYSMQKDIVLPEISVEMNEELSVSRNFDERIDEKIKTNNSRTIKRIKNMTSNI